MARWTKGEIDYLKKHAHDMTATDIAKELNRTQSSVSHYARRHNISLKNSAEKRSQIHRQHIFKENFFAENTPEVNYWAGALLADGCVNERSKNSHTIELYISQKDLSWLKKFKESLGASHPIINKAHDHVGLTFFSNKMFEDLRRFGVVLRKTYNPALPKVNDNMMSHFLRGLLDGDGCISKNKQTGVVEINLTNNECICNWVKNKVNKILNISGHLYSDSRSDITWSWRIHCKKDLEIFGKWLYQKAEVFMERKYQRYIDYGVVSRSEVML